MSKLVNKQREIFKLQLEDLIESGECKALNKLIDDRIKLYEKTKQVIKPVTSRMPAPSKMTIVELCGLMDCSKTLIQNKINNGLIEKIPSESKVILINFTKTKEDIENGLLGFNQKHVNQFIQNCSKYI